MSVLADHDGDIEEAVRLTWEAACIFIDRRRVWAAIEEVAAFLLLRDHLNEDDLSRLLDPVRRPLPPLAAPA